MSPRSGHDLGLLFAPCHAPSLTDDDVRAATGIARENHLHVINWTEAYNRIAVMMLRPLWDLIVGRSRTDHRRGPKDNPILVHKRRTFIHESGAFKACRAARPRRIAPERWVTWVLFETMPGLLVLNVCIHPHPGVQNELTLRSGATRYLAWQGRRRGYFRQLRKVERLVQKMRAKYGDELHPVIAGDVNSTEDWTAEFSAAAVFERLGLHTYWHGILAIAFDPRLRLDAAPEVISTAVNGQDHPWFVATFKEK